MKSKVLTPSQLIVGRMYRIITSAKQTTLITFLGGEKVMLSDGSESYLIPTDRFKEFKFVELFTSICLN